MNFSHHIDPVLFIVDDDKDDLELVREIYEELDVLHNVKMFNSGDELLDFLNGVENNLRPTLIVLDYNMPKLTGVEVLSILKTDPQYREIPIVFYSTTLTELIEKELLLSGATYCHQKPSNVSAMKDLMTEFWSIAVSFHQKSLINK
ncbi:MAG: response regulator [Flavisolibacter sp.]